MESCVFNCSQLNSEHIKCEMFDRYEMAVYISMIEDQAIKHMFCDILSVYQQKHLTLFSAVLCFFAKNVLFFAKISTVILIRYFNKSMYA